jgi:hypothetical protein
MPNRTPTDYALEFAEYMAKSAEQLIEAVNKLAMAEQARDEGEGDDPDEKVNHAQQDCTEFLTGLRNDIYQFRSRRDRAAREASTGAPAADAAQDAARYRWMRAAWLEGVEDDTDPVAQQVLGTVQNEAEVDAVIDAQIAAGNWPVRP